MGLLQIRRIQKLIDEAEGPLEVDLYPASDFRSVLHRSVRWTVVMTAVDGFWKADRRLVFIHGRPGLIVGTAGIGGKHTDEEVILDRARKMVETVRDLFPKENQNEVETDQD